ncbi:MAG: Do family serine endopeptidase [Litorimonas sp.]
MRKSIILTTAAIAISLAPLAFVGSSEAQTRFSQSSEAMTIDSRGILTMAPLLERVTPAVVSITTIGEAPEDSREEQLLGRLFGDQLPQRRAPREGLGSGVIVDAAKGLILTNDHVIDASSQITVTLEDKRRFEAEVIGTDPQTDIALLKIEADDLTALKLAGTNESRVGDFVIAVGNPFGLSSTVTSGIISAKGRDQRSADNYSDFIQTDASINPGNSGGALVNSKGELIGINSAIVTRSGGNQGIGFAVPIRIVKGVMKQLEAYGEVHRGRIGVVIQDITPDLREALSLGSLNGALISDVNDDTPAKKAGLQAQDVVVEFNGDDILDSSDLRNAVGLLEPGSRANITYIRNGKRRTTRIEVAEVEDTPADVEEEKSEDTPVLEGFDGALITDIPDDLELRGGKDGVLIESVERSSKAARAGLRRGDVIRRVGSKDVSNLSEFEKAIEGKDGPYALSIERGGSNLFLAVK